MHNNPHSILLLSSTNVDVPPYDILKEARKSEDRLQKELYDLLKQHNRNLEDMQLLTYYLLINVKMVRNFRTLVAFLQDNRVHWLNRLYEDYVRYYNRMFTLYMKERKQYLDHQDRVRKLLERLRDHQGNYGFPLQKDIRWRGGLENPDPLIP